MSNTHEKRKDVRLVFQAPLTVQWRSAGGAGTGTIGNMSRSGCYVMTRNPLPVGQQLVVRLGDLPEAEALIRRSDSQVGMGMEFVGLTREVDQKIADFLQAKAVVWA